MTSVDLPRTGFVVAANLQFLSGKPWAMTALVNPNEAARQVLIEPRGTRRLSGQTLLTFASRERSASATWDGLNCAWTCSMPLTTPPRRASAPPC